MEKDFSRHLTLCKWIDPQDNSVSGKHNNVLIDDTLEYNVIYEN